MQSNSCGKLNGRVFISFLASVELRILKAHLIEAVQGKFDLNSAVNIDSTIPSASVDAKPLTVPEPLQNRTAASNQGGYISVDDRGKCLGETCLDRIFLRMCPSPILLFGDTGEMITFASTAIPIGQDDTSHARKRQSHLKCSHRMDQYQANIQSQGNAAARPGSRYTAIINTMTMANPIRPAF